MEYLHEDSLRTGAISGAVAFVAGLVGAVLFAAPSEGDDLLKVTASAMGRTETRTLPWTEGSGSPAEWKVAGWAYHKAHFASIDSAFDLSGSSAQMIDVSTSVVLEPSPIARALPILIIGAAGYYVVSQHAVDDVAAAGTRGAHVVAGYLPLAVASVFLLSWEESGSSSGFQGSMTIEPNLVSAVLFTGLLFPLVVGALGGAVASKTGAAAE